MGIGKNLNTWQRSCTNATQSNTWRRSCSNATTSTQKVCKYWAKGNNSCRYGNSCRYLHSWTSCVGDTGFTFLTQLLQQQEDKEAAVIAGIALPSGSNQLYSGSKDGTVRVWDCQSGKCSRVINLDSEVSRMISEGPWIFLGLRNLVKAWNTQTGTELGLETGPVQVYALQVGNNMLLAGTKDGMILAWKCNNTSFEAAAALKGHTGSVVSMIVGSGEKRLYSGSMDNSIREWCLETLECLQILADEHTSAVMSLLCWDQFLISCSLDKTVKVWAANDTTWKLEVTYTHQEETGVLALCGMHESQAKPVLFCSCNDDTARVYDLPSFSERGKIFSQEGVAVRRIEIGPAGLFFTGDESGHIRVWKWG